ncbi:MULTISPECIES: type II toxin-antitoxin system ParD family antitoxin [Photorhabdus]|nr:type II toxin-antitoxin system ParD family antitoxin [Photorhabdus asymbiotica]RKS57009.1 antitoxin ParD1/3/4 [Photorhabdus asymbiotica]
MVSRTMTVDTGEKLRGFVESLVKSGYYKTNNEVVREGLRLLQEKQAESKLEALRQLIDEGDNSGDVVAWDLNIFLTRMKNKTHNVQ